MLEAHRRLPTPKQLLAGATGSAALGKEPAWLRAECRPTSGSWVVPVRSSQPSSRRLDAARPAGGQNLSHRDGLAATRPQ
jgi:hypothetical protein